MQLKIGKPDGGELLLAEHTNGGWRASPTLATDMAAFLKDSDPEQFELWVEEDDED